MRAVRRQLDEDERIAWLRLARTPNIGPSTFAALLNEFGGIHEALRAAPGLARRGGNELKITAAEIAERELAAVNALSGRILACTEPEFPQALAAIDPPPPVITVLGQPDVLADVLKREIVAIVGARNASAVNGGAKLVHPGGAKLVHLTLCGTRCWGVVPVVHRRDPRCLV